jgi:hypothetical protein
MKILTKSENGHFYDSAGFDSRQILVARPIFMLELP